MRPKHLTWFVVLASAFLAYGQEPSTREVPLSFELTASPSPSGRSENVKLEVKNGDIKAFRVFSEPSHTLLAAFVDNSDGDPAGTEWYSRLAIPPGTTVATLPLHVGAKVNAQGKRALAGDEKLALHIFGIWPGESSAREDVINVRTNVDSFHFSINRVHNYIQICCNGGDCGGTNCKFCPGGDVRCCLENGCSFCGQSTAGCTSDPCPHC